MSAGVEEGSDLLGFRLRILSGVFFFLPFCPRVLFPSASCGGMEWCAGGPRKIRFQAELSLRGSFKPRSGATYLDGAAGCPEPAFYKHPSGD